MSENIYNGYPSIILPQRPFFSIIVACYNSRNTLPALLDSIIHQDMNDQIEVILSDDCSTESYQDIVDNYKQILSIRQVQTDYNFAPGNTREKGVSVAEGEWICFADHDDEFISNSLSIIKNTLIEAKEDKFAIANFIEVNPITNEVIREMIGTRNWNHAKFYNLDNLWKAYDIHFKKDLLTHEDIYISSLINCIIPDDQILYIDQFCYVWNARPTSVSRELYGDGTFLETFFDDYIESTGRVYLRLYNEGKTNAIYAIQQCIIVVLYTYFYIMGFIFHNPSGWKKENLQIAREFLVQVKQTFQINNQFIWNFSANDDAELFMKIKAAASIASGPYIEEYSFGQYLDLLHTDIKPRVTMSESMKKEDINTENNDDDDDGDMGDLDDE